MRRAQGSGSNPPGESTGESPTPCVLVPLMSHLAGLPKRQSVLGSVWGPSVPGCDHKPSVSCVGKPQGQAASRLFQCPVVSGSHQCAAPSRSLLVPFCVLEPSERLFHELPHSALVLREGPLWLVRTLDLFWWVQRLSAPGLAPFPDWVCDPYISVCPGPVNLWLCPEVSPLGLVSGGQSCVDQSLASHLVPVSVQSPAVSSSDQWLPSPRCVRRMDLPGSVVVLGRSVSRSRGQQLQAQPVRRPPTCKPPRLALSGSVEVGLLGPGPGPAPFRRPHRAPCSGPRSLLPWLPPPPSRRRQPHAGCRRQRLGLRLVQASRHGQRLMPVRKVRASTGPSPSCPFKSSRGCGWGARPGSAPRSSSPPSHGGVNRYSSSSIPGKPRSPAPPDVT